MSDQQQPPPTQLPTGKQLGGMAWRMTKAAVARHQRTGTPSQNGPGAMDTTQGVIDLVGMADPFGVADLTNAMISTVRAYREPKRRFEHIRNAAVSVVSMLPYAGDMAKVAVAKRDVHAAMVIARGTSLLRKALKIGKRVDITQRAFRAGQASVASTQTQHEASQSFSMEAAKGQTNSELAAAAASTAIMPTTDAYHEIPEAISEQSEAVREHLEEARPGLFRRAGRMVKVAVAKRDVHAAMVIARGTSLLRKALKIGKRVDITQRAFRAGQASVASTQTQHEASQSFSMEAAKGQTNSELAAAAASTAIMPTTDAYHEIPEAIAEQSEAVREHLEEARPGLFRRAGRMVKENPGSSIAVAEGLMRVGLILADKQRDNPTRVKDAWSEIVDTVSRAQRQPSAWEASHEAITRGLDTFLPEGGRTPDDSDSYDDTPDVVDDTQFSVRQRAALRGAASRAGSRIQTSRQRFDPDLTMIAAARAERDRRRTAGRGTRRPVDREQIDWDSWREEGDDPQPSGWQRAGRMVRRATAPVTATARGAYGLARDVVVPAASAAMGTIAGGVIVSRLERARREREEHGLLGALGRQAYRTLVPATSRAAIGVGVAATGAAVSTTRVMIDFGKSMTDLTKNVRATNDVLMSNMRLLAQYNGHLATTYAFSELNQNLRRRFIASQTAGSYRALSSAQSTLGSQTAKYQSLAINFFNRAASFYTTLLSLGIAVAEKVTGIGTIVTLLNRAMGGMAKWTAAPHEMLLKDLADGTIMKARSKRKHP
jgi:hypothetical protein